MKFVRHPELLEKAARKYCELKGLNPDEFVMTTQPGSYDAQGRRRWRLVAAELEEFAIKLEAITSKV